MCSRVGCWVRPHQQRGAYARCVHEACAVQCVIQSATNMWFASFLLTDKTIAQCLSFASLLTPDYQIWCVAGYQVLSVTTANNLSTVACALGSQLSFGSPPLFGRCALAPSGATYLSVYVDQYCGGEHACSFPPGGSSHAQQGGTACVRVCCLPSRGVDWRPLLLPHWLAVLHAFASYSKSCSPDFAHQRQLMC